MAKYRISITCNVTKKLMHERFRDTMPGAVSAAEGAVYELHDMNSTRDRPAAHIDMDCAAGWNPRLAALVIIREPYTLKAEKL